MNSTEIKKLKVALKYWILGKAEHNPDYYNVLRAMNFAESYHTNTRKDGSPEFIHQLNIVSFLRTLEKSLINPVAVLITGFLHDVYEDYPECEAKLKELFPDHYEYSVRVSKIRLGEKIPYTQYFGEMAECDVCSVVKAVDRIHNISTMTGVFSEDKKKAYTKEVKDWFLPMMKKARNLFPEQEMAYENLKSVLNIQCDIINK